MHLSENGLKLIKQSEGFRARVYLDVAGFPTIGYGHKLLHPESFPNGVDEPQAAQILLADVRDAEDAVERLVKVPLTQGQFDALVDFVFNLGASRLAKSTLLVDLNAKRYYAAGAQLLLWDHGRVNGQEVELAALKVRREAEYQLWQLAA